MFFAGLELEVQVVDYYKDTLSKVEIFVVDEEVRSSFCFDEDNIITPTGYVNSCVQSGGEIHCIFNQIPLMYPLQNKAFGSDVTQRQCASVDFLVRLLGPCGR